MFHVIHQKFSHRWVRSSEHSRSENCYVFGTSENQRTQLSRTPFPNAYHFLLLARFSPQESLPGKVPGSGSAHSGLGSP